MKLQKRTPTIAEVINELDSNGLIKLCSIKEERKQQKISHVRTDSRTVEPSDCFIAYNGVNANSHAFIGSADNRGAALIIYDEPQPAGAIANLAAIQVTNSRKAWAVLSALMSGNPEKHLRFVGVTGTNGKTTTTFFLKQLLALINVESTCIGTNGYWIGEHHFPTAHTTPDPDVLFEILRESVNIDISMVIMEVSSQAILHEKLASISFDAGIFTSFSRDHLDLHKTMTNYWNCKIKFLNELVKGGSPKLVYEEIDQPIDGCDIESPYLSYSSRDTSSISVVASEDSLLGSTIKITSQNSEIEGEVTWFSLENHLNFCAALYLCKELTDKCPPPQQWKKVASAPGRLELVSSEPFYAFVDYAHTPDGLDKLLQSVKSLKATRSKLILVFGSGGERDKGKRPQMGAIAARYADLTIITTDNPRGENPDNIMAEISVGHGKTKLMIKDRRAAIAEAVKVATRGDIIIVAGKGHEEYQIIGKEKYPFSDKLELLKEIERQA